MSTMTRITDCEQSHGHEHLKWQWQVPPKRPMPEIDRCNDEEHREPNNVDQSCCSTHTARCAFNVSAQVPL
jgi:hypothetical protein